MPSNEAGGVTQWWSIDFSMCKTLGWTLGAIINQMVCINRKRADTVPGKDYYTPNTTQTQRFKEHGEML